MGQHAPPGFYFFDEFDRLPSSRVLLLLGVGLHPTLQSCLMNQKRTALCVIYEIIAGGGISGVDYLVARAHVLGYEETGIGLGAVVNFNSNHFLNTKGFIDVLKHF